MEKFSLKWDAFQSNVSKSFQKLRNEKDFFDVTLVGEDGTHVLAHKLLLASSSEYLKNIFIYSKMYFQQSHALICLEGLQQDDLNNILDYIYQGEVQIYQKDMDRFLAVAQRLKLEGLTGDGEEQQEEEKDANYFQDEIVVSENYLQEEMTVPENHSVQNKTIITPIIGNLRTKEKPKISIQSSDIHSMEELDQKIEESFSRDATGNFVCHHCNKTDKRKDNMKEHVEIHFDNLSFPCNFCGKVSRSRNALRVHKSRNHSNQV